MPTPPFQFTRLSNKFRSELTDIKFEMEKLKQEKGEGVDSAERFLELAQKASSLYVRQVSDEKRTLHDLVCREFHTRQWGAQAKLQETL